MYNHCDRDWGNWWGGCGCGCGGCDCGAWSGCCCHRNGSRFQTFTLSGMVTSTANGSVSGISIQYIVDCVTYIATTDAAGRFSVVVPRNTNVTITLAPIVGVTVSPEQYVLKDINCDIINIDFTLTPLVAITNTFSGMVTGMPSNMGIPINYTVNGVAGVTTTGANGAYTIAAPPNANVTVKPAARSGYAVSPPSYAISSMAGNVTGKNFMYTSAARAVAPPPAVAGRAGIPAGAACPYNVAPPAGPDFAMAPVTRSGHPVQPMTTRGAGMPNQIM